MKKFTQNLLVNYALAVLAIFVANSLAFGIGDYARYHFELLLVIIVIRLLLLLTNKFQSRWPVLEYLLELGMVLATVLGFGWLFEWYDMNYLGYMIATIVAVYIGVYAVGIGRARRDAAFINEQIKLRRVRIKEIEMEVGSEQ